MILHIFNSTVVSGPERLVLPTLAPFCASVKLAFLYETRCGLKSDQPVDYARSLGFDPLVIKVKSRWDREAIGEIARQIECRSPLIVHAHDVKASTYLQAASRLLNNADKPKLVSTHHGIRGRRGLKLRLYERFYSYLVLPSFDRVLTVCESDRVILQQRGIASERLLCHRNGTRSSSFGLSERMAADQLRQNLLFEARLHDATDPILLGVVGRLAPEKRLDRVLKVVSKLKGFNWRLVVFGSGPLEQQLRGLAGSLGIKDRIIWLGYRANAAIEVGALDLLISLSDAEGLPLNILEAGSAGVPVFATKVDGIAEVIPSGEFGSLVLAEQSDSEIALELGRVLASRPKMIARAEKLKSRVGAEFSSERWLSQLGEIYGDLLIKKDSHSCAKLFIRTAT